MNHFVPLLLSLLIVPLISAGLITIFFRRSKWIGAVLSVCSAGFGMFLSLYILCSWRGEVMQVSTVWMQLGPLLIRMGFLLDSQVATMLFVVTFVSFWIHLFSVDYMKKDPAKGRYFAGLSFFMFSILGITLADNLFMLFVFWELVGCSSYLLIAHYYESPFAQMASKKAFIVNRIGDFGFLVGIVWVYHCFGTVELTSLRTMLSDHPALLKPFMGILLACGFIGKSAQFPLQVWLPDAMAGPTPVSALIHAATMVAAGIYFMARTLFLFTPSVLEWIVWSSVLMTVFAGFCALGQRDIKKILAYSTLSQLGYMATALGLSLPGLALFHLATHACFKATLFLGAGSLICALHHEQDIYKMGGLLRRMPVTGLTFLVATLSICAVHFTSGYYSKEAIIGAAYLRSKGMFVLLAFAALLTAVYMGRLFWVVFLGKPRSEGAVQAKEGSFCMILPLLLLGVFSVGECWAWPVQAVQSFCRELMQIHLEFSGSAGRVLLTSGILAYGGGFLISYFVYGRSRTDRVEEKVPVLYRLWERHGFFDEVYDWYVGRVQQPFVNVLRFLDLAIFPFFLVRGSAMLFRFIGFCGRTLHVGSLHSYVYWFLIGLLLFSFFAFKG